MAYDENPRSIWDELWGFFFNPITTYGRWLMYKARSIEDDFPLSDEELGAYRRLIIVSTVLGIVLIAAIVALGIFVLPLIIPATFGAGLVALFATSVSLFTFTLYVSLPTLDFVANKTYEFVSNIYSVLQTGVNKLLSLFKSESDAAQPDAVAAENDSGRGRSGSHHSSTSVSAQSDALAPDSASSASASDFDDSTEENGSVRGRSDSHHSSTSLSISESESRSNTDQFNAAAAEDGSVRGRSDRASSFPASPNAARPDAVAALEPVQAGLAPSASDSDDSAEENSSVRGRDRAFSLPVSSLNVAQPYAVVLPSQFTAVGVKEEGAATDMEIQSDGEDVVPAEQISIPLRSTNQTDEFISETLATYYSSAKKESSPESNANFGDNENLKSALAKLQELLTRMSGYAKELTPVKTVTKEISERFVYELGKNRPFSRNINDLVNCTLEDAAKAFSAYDETQVPSGVGKVSVGVLLQHASRFLNTLEQLIVYVEKTFSPLNLDDRNTNTPLITIINKITVFFQIVTQDKLRTALVQATASSIPASGLALLLSFRYDGSNKSSDKAHYDKYKKHEDKLYKLASHFAVTIQGLAESIHKEFSKFVDDFLETGGDNYSAYRTNLTLNFEHIKQFKQRSADQIDTKSLICWLINTLAINNPDEIEFFKTFFQHNDLRLAYLENLKRVIATSLTHERDEGKITSFLREMHFLHKLHYTIYQEQAQKKSVAGKFDFLQSLARPLILLRRLHVLLDNVNKEADQKLQEGFTTYFDKTKQAHSKPNNHFDNTLDHGYLSTIRKLEAVLKGEADKAPSMYDIRATFQNKVMEILHNNFFIQLGVNSRFLPEELQTSFDQMMHTIDSSLNLDALKSEIKGNHDSEELTKLRSACTDYMEKAEQFVSTKHQQTIDTILSGLFSVSIDQSNGVTVKAMSTMLLNYFCKEIHCAFNIVIAESRAISDVDKFKSALQTGCDPDEVNDSMRLLKEKIESYVDSRPHSEDDIASISTTFRNDFFRLSTHFFKIMEFRVKPKLSQNSQLRKAPVTNGMFSERPQPNGDLQQSEQLNDRLRA